MCLKEADGKIYYKPVTLEGNGNTIQHCFFFGEGGILIPASKD